jgi:hypothetical protein
MRLALLAAIPAVALALLGGASAAQPARVPSYCSKSGDVCYWIVEARADYNLRLTLAVSWQRNFPDAPGRYRVTWSQGTNRLGPPLNFRLSIPA